MIVSWVKRLIDLSCSSPRHAVVGGYRNISNALSIGTKIDRMSEGLTAAAEEKGLWDGSGTFNFSAAFASEVDGSGGRKECGEKLLADLSKGGKCVVIVVFGMMMCLFMVRISLSISVYIVQFTYQNSNIYLSLSISI